MSGKLARTCLKKRAHRGNKHGTQPDTPGKKGERQMAQAYAAAFAGIEKILRVERLLALLEILPASQTENGT